MKRILNKFNALKSALGASVLYGISIGVAHAESITTAVSGGQSCSTTAGTANDPFQGFLCLIYQWVSGDLGIAVSLLALVFGIIVGMGKSSLTPALVGVGVASLFMLGPNVISYIVTGAQIAPHMAPHVAAHLVTGRG